MRSFTASGVYLWSTTYGQASAPYIVQWNDIGEHFIGFRLCYSFDTLYAWIRVEATDAGDFILSIKDFACNRNTHIGIHNAPRTNELLIYPNPFHDRIYVKHKYPGKAELVLYTLQEEVLLQKFTGDLEISTRKLPSGLYFYKLTEGPKEWRGKVIKE